MKKFKRMPLLLKTIENFSFMSCHPRSYYTALKFNIIYRCKPLPLSVCLSLISFNRSTLIIIIITTIPSHHQYRRLSLFFSYTCRDGCSFLFVLFVCFFFSIFPHFVLRNISFAACPILSVFLVTVILVFCLVVFIFLFYDFYLFEFFCSVILRFTRFLEVYVCVFALRFGHPGLFHHHFVVFFVSVYLPFTIIIITSHHYHHHHHY